MFDTLQMVEFGRRPPVKWAIIQLYHLIHIDKQLVTQHSNTITRSLFSQLDIDANPKYNSQ